MIDFLIHSPISHYGKATPDHPALCFQGESMSYAALDAASNQLAHALLERGLQHQDHVGIYMHKGLDLGVAIYGVLKAGGVFVPLDPLLPEQRLAFILKDCGVQHLVASDKMQRALRGLAGELESDPLIRILTLYGVQVDTPFGALSWDAIREQPVAAPDVWIIDQDLGYIMYTSGSTGEPKGMMHTHHGSNSYARWGALHVGLCAADRVASHAPLHFDLSIFDFFSTAQVGATVVLVPEPVTKFPASWTECIESQRISHVFTVPFTLIDMMARGVMEQRDLSSLKWILFGGEPFPPKHLRDLMQMLPDVRFTNVYGPAEAPSCTAYDVPPLPEDYDEALPIGTVSKNSEDLILDESGELCADGEEGELCIRSSTLTKGYWKRPDLNARVFLERPSFGPFPHVWFRTGDLVVRHADGQLRFLGRKDRMVKARGYRIELDEIEAALASHAAVSEAAAFAVADGQGSKKILAVVTLAEGHTADDTELVRHARARLPNYAVPEHTQIVADLPRTTSGKIDRKQLASQHEEAHPS